MKDHAFTVEEERILVETFDRHLADGHLDGDDVTDEVWDESFRRALEALEFPGGATLLGNDLLYAVACGAVLADGREHEEEELVNSVFSAITAQETADQKERHRGRWKAAQAVFLMCLHVREGRSEWSVGADGRMRWRVK